MFPWRRSPGHIRRFGSSDDVAGSATADTEPTQPAPESQPPVIHLDRGGIHDCKGNGTGPPRAASPFTDEPSTPEPERENDFTLIVRGTKELRDRMKRAPVHHRMTSRQRHSGTGSPPRCSGSHRWRYSSTLERRSRCSRRSPRPASSSTGHPKRSPTCCAPTGFPAMRSPPSLTRCPRCGSRRRHHPPNGEGDDHATDPTGPSAQGDLAWDDGTDLEADRRRRRRNPQPPPLDIGARHRRRHRDPLRRAFASCGPEASAVPSG